MARTAKEKSSAVKAYEAAVKSLADAKEKNSKNATDANKNAVEKAAGAVRMTLAAVNRERFLTLGKIRVNNVLAALGVLEQCANRKSYDFKAEEIDKALNAIAVKVQAIRGTFEAALKAPTGTPEVKDQGFQF